MSASIAEYIASRCKPVDGCLLWQLACTRSGYARCKVQALSSQYAHVAAWTHVHGPVPADMVLGNLCGHRHCCNPAHWSPMTRAEQNRVAAQRGAWRGGERIVKIARAARRLRGKLDEAKVARIRTGRESCAALARELGVSRSLVSKVRHGMGWAPLVAVQQIPSAPLRHEVAFAPPVFSALPLGEYLPSDSAIARAYPAVKKV